MQQDGLLFPKRVGKRKVPEPEALLFSKKKQTRKNKTRLRHPDSIMHRKDGTCFLCMILHDDYRKYDALQRHHVIFGKGKKQLSEKYGIVVYLCHCHHTAGTGTEAVHENAEVCHMLQQMGQQAFEQEYPDENFIEIFGKNYVGVYKGGMPGE